jgi:hypothetical protein
MATEKTESTERSKRFYYPDSSLRTLGVLCGFVFIKYSSKSYITPGARGVRQIVPNQGVRRQWVDVEKSAGVGDYSSGIARVTQIARFAAPR